MKKAIRNCLLTLSMVAPILGCGPRHADTPVEPSMDAEPVEVSERTAPTLSTPLDALQHYIESLRRGDVEGVHDAMIATNFHLPAPIAIDSFEVLRFDTLSTASAAERNFIPQPQPGDVELDVLHHEYGQEQKYTYNLRRIDDQWQIYAHSAWGVGYYDDGE